MKYSMYSLLFFLLIITTSCRTRLPEVDTTPPTFHLEIIGDGFNRTFTQDDNFSRMQLNLRSNTEFRFVYSGADPEGVRLIQWQLGGSDRIDFIQPEFPFASWTIRDISAFNRMIEWSRDRSDIRTGSIISGRFRTGNGINQTGTWRLITSDFGGQSGTPNSVSGNLSIQIIDSETELIEF